MSVEVVVARYCEDLGWLADLPREWRVTIYDKSQGGPRHRLDLGHWKSADGPDEAPLWPGAIVLPNIGCEAHTYFHHVATRYDSLADLTAFVSGDALAHWPEMVGVVTSAEVGRADYVGCDRFCTCDDDGQPHHPGLGSSLLKLWGALREGVPLPRRLLWNPFGMFAASRARLRETSRAEWTLAEHLCFTKDDACAMERLWRSLLAQPRGEMEHA